MLKLYVTLYYPIAIPPETNQLLKIVQVTKFWCTTRKMSTKIAR